MVPWRHGTGNEQSRMSHAFFFLFKKGKKNVWLTLAGLNLPFKQHQLINIWVWSWKQRLLKTWYIHTHTHRNANFYTHFISALQEPLISHTLCMHACISCTVFICVSFNTNPRDNLGAFCGVHRLLWARSLGCDVWQELSYWPRFVKPYNLARLAPFTPLRSHLTFNCMPLSMPAFG